MAAISMAMLISITIPATGESLRYQNYQNDVFVFDEKLYSFAGFEIRTYPKNDLSMGSEDMAIAVRNTQLVQALLRAYDRLRGAIVEIYHIQPGLDVPGKGWRFELATTTTEGSAIIFTLKGPTNALVGALVGKSISAIDFPHLPHYLPQL